MAHKVIDRCKETTSTTGTGTLTLTGAVANFVAMANATAGLTANGDTSWFCAENGAEWEVFLGTRVDATHLARTTVIASSNAGAAVSFTAAPTVFGTVPASKLSTAGPSFSAYLATASQSISTATWTKVQLNAESFDAGNCFDSTTNYRFQPNVAGNYQVTVNANMSGASMSASEVAIYKNGAAIAFGSYGSSVGNAFVTNGTKLIPMNGTTDYLEMFIYASGTSLVVNFGDTGTFMTGYLASLPGTPMLAPIVAPGPSFHAYLATTNQSVTSGVATKVAFNAEEFDTGDCFDSTTNRRFQPNVEGYYSVSWCVRCDAPATTITDAAAILYKNGASYKVPEYVGAASASLGVVSSALVYMNGTTDYLEVYVYISGTTPRVAFGQDRSYFCAYLAALPQVPQPTSGPVFSAYRATSNQSITSGVTTKVQLNAAEFDTNGCFDSTTNYRFTPNVAGYYAVDFSVNASAASAMTSLFCNLLKNGSNIAFGSYSAPVGGTEAISVGSKTVYLNGTTDYLELWANIAGTTPVFKFGSDRTYLSGHFVRGG